MRHLARCSTQLTLKLSGFEMKQYNLKFIEGALGASIISLLPEFDTGGSPILRTGGYKVAPLKRAVRLDWFNHQLSYALSDCAEL